MIYAKAFLVLAFLALAVFSISVNSKKAVGPLAPKWNAWKAQHGKMYSGREDNRRMSIFYQNAVRIEEMKRVNPLANFTLNKFADLSEAEFKSLYLMSQMPPRQPVAAEQVAKKASPVALPSEYDWSSKGALTPVKNQGQCGSCWAFSATETVESVCFLAGKGLNHLSEQQVVDCTTTCYGCNGGWTYYAFEYLISCGGQEYSSDYPYTAQTGQCNFNSADIACSISSWKYVTQDQDENAMQQFLYSNSPLSICVDASTWQFYNGGVLSTCGTNIDHCVQATGWSQQSGQQAWNVRNSWGTDWGVNGYIYLAFGQDTCAMAQVVTVPCVGSVC